MTMMGKRVNVKSEGDFNVARDSIGVGEIIYGMVFQFIVLTQDGI